MDVESTALPGVLLVKPRVFGDDRGFFLETYNETRYREAGIDVSFVQDNHSCSRQGTLRGLHFQTTNVQDKLVWAIQGEIFDVAVDVRRSSPHFGKWVGARLSAENKHQLFVPKGFAHGFCVLSETAEVMYKCSDVYAPGAEGGILWNDPTLNIDWPIKEPILSPKDEVLPRFEDAQLFD